MEAVETATVAAEVAPPAAVKRAAAETPGTAAAAEGSPQETVSPPEPMEGEIPFSTAARRRK